MLLLLMYEVFVVLLVLLVKKLKCFAAAALSYVKRFGGDV